MQPIMLTTNILRGLAAVGVFALTGCASVSNHNTSDEDIGFEHYAGKHYLVVEPGKDGTHSFKVVTLPDLSKPRYIRHHEGWGSVQFSFTLENGVLTEFGSTSDSKAVETFQTVGTLGTAYGALLGTKVTADAAIAVAEFAVTPMAAFDGLKVGADGRDGAASISVTALKDIASELVDRVVAPLLNTSSDQTNQLGSEISSIATNVSDAASLDPAGELSEEIAKSRKAVASAARALTEKEASLKLVREGLKNNDDATIISTTLPVIARLTTRLKAYAVHGLEMSSGLRPIIFEIIETTNGIDFRPVVLEPSY